MSGIVIAEDDPGRDDVVRLLERHLAHSYEHSPPEDVYALDIEGLRRPDITFYSARRRGSLVAVGALRQIDGSHGEIKSMHTAEAERGRGVGRAVLEHLMDVARRRGYARVSLETGTMDAYAAARALYAGAGFRPCPPFGDYRASPNSVCMTVLLHSR